jgi:alpha-galactosidase
MPQRDAAAREMSTLVSWHVSPDGLQSLSMTSIEGGDPSPIPVRATECAPRPEEREEARAWVAAKLGGRPEVRKRRAGMTVLSAPGAVAKGRCLLGGGGGESAEALRCPATTRILVRLPAPGRRFTAAVMFESPHLGSGAFSVTVAERETWRAEVGRQKRIPTPVEVDLGGAGELILEATTTPFEGTTAGDIGCWVRPRVTLEDGAGIALIDLPIEGRTGLFDATPPFSFVYGGRDSTELLWGWRVERSARPLDVSRTEHTVTYTDPQTGLVVCCMGVEFHDYPTVEWTLYLRNGGTVDTPIIEGINAVDTTFERDAQGEYLLHHNAGSPYGPRDFEPFETALPPKTEKRIATSGGRSSNLNLPYFNLAWAGAGVVIVIGWPGQWGACFARDDQRAVRITAGQEAVRFLLHPGEEVRSPRIVLQFWRGDWIRAQNVWRRWLRAHNTPRPGGKEPVPKTAANLWFQFYGGDNDAGLAEQATEAAELEFLNGYLEHGIGLDYWWIDAGWYRSESWSQTGTWEVDTVRYPRGLRSVFDYARTKGLGSVVWFEPERVTPGTWLYERHPEWLLGDKGWKLLNLGNPEAARWLTERVSDMIREEGIDVYRNDFNMDPLAYWRANDAPDRQGISEIAYIQGFLGFWDELLRRYPDLLIDSCSSGTRRSDIETLRRSVTYWRSDYIREPVAQQCQTYGISQWYTICANGVMAEDTYTFRSNVAPVTAYCYDVRKKLDFPLLKKLTDQWRSVMRFVLGDFYPLTPWSLDSKEWMAWQFNCPEMGEGMVQAFRRADSIYESARFVLRDLDPGSRYVVSDLDRSGDAEIEGRKLLGDGLLVDIPGRPGAAIVTYRKVT